MTFIDRFGVFLVGVTILSSALALEEMDFLEVDTGNRTGRYQRIANRVTKTGLNLNSCDTQSGYSGTCMTRFNCMKNGGTVSGYCGTYGVCCETNMLCGRTSSLKRTLIQTPSSIPTRCTYVFQPYNINVCQIKIEMEEFRLQQPQDVTGVTAGDTIECVDRFEVNGFTLCGNNDGQHLYVPFDVSGGTDANVNLVFILPNQDPVSRWRLIVTQLECPTATVRKGMFPFAKTAGFQDLKNIFASKNNDLTLLAPRGCSQYFTERTGTIESFNYNNGAGRYMTKLNYAICFQRLASDSGIQFQFSSFQLAVGGVQTGYDADCHPIIPAPGMVDDYLMIPGAIVTSSVITLQPTYFCGTAIASQTVVYGAPGPFVIYFNSDIYSSADEIGFQIRYTIV